MKIEQFIKEILDNRGTFVLNYNGLDELEESNRRPVIEVHSAVFTSVHKLRDDLLSFSHYQKVGADIYKGEPIDRVSMATGMSLYIDVNKIERVVGLQKDQYQDLFESSWSEKAYRIFLSNGDVISLGMLG